jgi:glycosyltransferase involved in cell wall biosynthesis
MAVPPRKRRRTILLVGDTLHVGGTEGQFVQLALRLNRSKWDIDVTCVRAEGRLRATLEAAGIAVWTCGRGSFTPVPFLRAVWSLARYLRARDISLVHAFGFYSNILGVLAARLAGTPVVVASQRDLGDLRSKPACRLHSSVLRFADRVVVNSEAVAERLQGRRALTQRVAVIRNGVDLGRFSPRTEGATLGRDTMTVGTLANLRPEKGLLELVRAAALVHDRCPSARFLVWGDGPLRRDLEAAIRQFQLDGIVTLAGSTDEPELVLRRLDVFVLPSLSEACSNGLLEAMATALPVVTTDVGGNPLLVEHEMTGLRVPPGDPPALAAAIVRLIDTPEFAKALAIRARARVQATFGLDRMVADTESFYEEALAQASDGREPDVARMTAAPGNVKGTPV